MSDTYVLKEKFKVTKLRYDVIFNIEWLEVKNKQVDWLARTISFKDGGCKVILCTSISSEEKKWSTTKDLFVEMTFIKKQIQHKKPVYIVVPNLASMVEKTIEGVERAK